MVTMLITNEQSPDYQELLSFFKHNGISFRNNQVINYFSSVLKRFEGKTQNVLKKVKRDLMIESPTLYTNNNFFENPIYIS